MRTKGRILLHHDVVDLRDFYRGRHGQVARVMIRRASRELWPSVSGLRVLGVGYATPFLRPYLGEAERVVAAMPASQGCVHWPGEGPNRVLLAGENELPLPDSSFERVIIAHCLETTENLRGLLREVWRVLTDDGRVIVVAPNRRGIWARFDRTPFGHGHPYSSAQLSRLLREHMFTPTASAPALFLPPLRSTSLLRSSAAVERLGRRFFPTFSGVVLAEAGKQLWAMTGVPENRKLVRGKVVPFPQAASRNVAERRQGPPEGES